MNRVAQLSAAERLDLFQETATRRGVSAAVIEKDFWACWVLMQLFADADLRTKALFMTVWRPSTRSAENSCGIRQG